MIKRNYHTHTLFCDGKDTPEEMVLSAIDKGFATLGFSGHSPLDGTDWGMNGDRLSKYKNEIHLLKEKYKDKIEILCGIEQDYYSGNSLEGYDYIIGSVHCLKVSDGYLPLDDSADILKEGIVKYFGSDPVKLAKCYYETVSDVVNKTGCQIIGHFDLITKFDDTAHIFDTANAEYIESAKTAIDKLSRTGALFEVNTGAMTRRLKSLPYPAKDLLEYIRNCGCDVVINSDCHDKNYLDFGFDTALSLIKECGFQRIAYISEGGIKYTDI